MAGIPTNDTGSEDKERFSPASTFISLVEYDKKAMTLDLTFQSGSKHRYFRVFPTTFLSFKQSPTHDAYYSRLIRGKMMSVKLIDASIGRDLSSPLKQVQKKEPLDAGLREQRSGTVARAFVAAEL